MSDRATQVGIENVLEENINPATSDNQTNGNQQVKVTSVDYTAGQSGVDSVTESIITIGYEHHEVHSGSSFIVSDVLNISSTTAYWMITTPDSTSYTHMIIDLEATGEMLAVITEGADRTGTTSLAVINRRRVGTPRAATTVIHRGYSDGTTNGATTIYSRRTGATGVGGKTLTGGGNRGLNEYVLKPNTKYIIAVTTYDNIYISMTLDWYEHTDKN